MTPEGLRGDGQPFAQSDDDENSLGTDDGVAGVCDGDQDCSSCRSLLGVEREFRGMSSRRCVRCS